MLDEIVSRDINVTGLVADAARLYISVLTGSSIGQSPLAQLVYCMICMLVA